MGETIKVNNEADLEKAIEKIKSENLVPAKEPYDVEKDPAFCNERVRRWNFKKSNTDDLHVIIHLVYPPSFKEKVESRMR